MIRVPAGEFVRGTDGGLPEEGPQRTLWLSEFEIDELPVTWSEFQQFLDAGGAAKPRFLGDPAWLHVTGSKQPVVGITWSEADAYAQWVGKRLPTEAEWEKAARGTEGRIYPWGNEWEPGRCSFRGGPKRAAPEVGSFPTGASPYGVLDMSGGVWEWCSDWFDTGYYAVAPDHDPRGPPTGTMRVARGGAWSAPSLLNRTANRNAWKPHARFSNLGFRCARGS